MPTRKGGRHTPKPVPRHTHQHTGEVRTHTPRKMPVLRYRANLFAEVHTSRSPRGGGGAHTNQTETLPNSQPMTNWEGTGTQGSRISEWYGAATNGLGWHVRHRIGGCNHASMGTCISAGTLGWIRAYRGRVSMGVAGEGVHVGDMGVAEVAACAISGGVVQREGRPYCWRPKESKPSTLTYTVTPRAARHQRPQPRSPVLACASGVAPPLSEAL